MSAPQSTVPLLGEWDKFTQNPNGKKTSVPREDIAKEMESNLSSSQQWLKPKPLKSNLLSVLSVSPSMLPEQLRPWLIDISNRMKCPLDFVASATVVMLSSLIGTRLAIKPKAKDDWTIIVNLWGAAIGDPSTMKTPSVSEVFKTLNRLIAESIKIFEEEMQCYEAEQLTYEVQKKVYQAQEQDRLKGKPVSNPIGYPESPKKPTERRYMTNDASIEKIGELLNENPTGLLQFRDELTGLLTGWDRSGKEQDRAFYLEAWNGNGSMTIDRIGRGTTHVKNVCVSLFGGIQPSKLMGYLKAANQFDNDGFVQRLQVSVYPNKPTWEYVDEFPDAYARDKAFAIIRKITESDFSEIAYDADDYNRYPYTRFASEAQEIFKQWITDWETNVLPNESGLLLEHFTKYRSLMPSLALIFHVVNCVDKPGLANPQQKYLVSTEAALMAVEWCTYLQSHARRIYGLLDNQQVEAAKTLLQHIKIGHLKDGFKARDVQRKGWSGLSDQETIESALSELIATHWLKEVQTDQPTGGRPEAPHYLINPEIIQNA
ncbi:YfjI family protein [Spirosoma gilvum]